MQTNDEKFQELVRVVDATAAEYDNNGLITGKNCLNFIKLQVETTTVSQFISPEFHEFILEQLKLSEGKEHVREHVKKILMYPTFTYPPWTPYKCDEGVLKVINDAYSQSQFRLKIIDGKVYAVCDSDLSSFVYSHMLTQDHDTFSELEANAESCHVTVINSNVIAPIGVDRVRSFLDSWVQPFNITFGDIKSTTSLDWTKFSKCYVILIKSDVVREFVLSFNEEFGTNVRICEHITFAVKPRSLFTTL